MKGGTTAISGIDAGPVAGLDLTVSTTSFGYPHPDSDARWLTELAIVATLWSAGEVIP